MSENEGDPKACKVCVKPEVKNIKKITYLMLLALLTSGVWTGWNVSEAKDIITDHKIISSEIDSRQDTEIANTKEDVKEIKQGIKDLNKKMDRIESYLRNKN